MLKLNIHQAKTHLSRYLAQLKPGERILLCQRNVPIAEIRAVPAEPELESRPIGLGKADFHVPETFFEPLPESELTAFEQYPVRTLW